MILVLDNYDSFSFNLVQYVGETGCEVVVKRNDAATVAEVLSLEPRGIIVSPGPGRPENAGVSVELIRQAAGKVPVLGVCLGHQALGYAYGGRVVGAPELVHGKASWISHRDGPLFEGVPNPFLGGRYHSLVVERESLPDCLEITAETEDGLVMALAHKEAPLWGVQFHPESILTDHGKRIVRNFLGLCGERMEAAV